LVEEPRCPFLEECEERVSKRYYRTVCRGAYTMCHRVEVKKRPREWFGGG